MTKTVGSASSSCSRAVSGPRAPSVEARPYFSCCPLSHRLAELTGAIPSSRIHGSQAVRHRETSPCISFT